MNLYLLKVTEKAYIDYDCARGFVVRACSGEAARGMVASSQPRMYGDEGARTWLEPALSTCDEIAEGVEGASGVLLRDFNAG